MLDAILIGEPGGRDLVSFAGHDSTLVVNDPHASEVAIRSEAERPEGAVDHAVAITQAHADLWVGGNDAPDSRQQTFVAIARWLSLDGHARGDRQSEERDAKVSCCLHLIAQSA